MTYEVNDDVYPATAVVIIEARWGSQTAYGSGFLVGRNDILTAAHVVFNYARGGLADKIEFTPSSTPTTMAKSP